MEISDKDLELWSKEISGCKVVESNKVANVKKINVDVNNKTLDVSNSYNNHNKTYLYDKIYFKIEQDRSLGLDYNSDKKLRTGKYKIDKTIDFHGMTINQAFDLFVNSIDLAYENGLRCILYITGKGNNSKIGNDTIKESFKRWIKMDFVSDKIIKYTQATNKNGGSGAFYVLLKRNKNSYYEDCF